MVVDGAAADCPRMTGASGCAMPSLFRVRRTIRSTPLVSAVVPCRPTRANRYMPYLLRRSIVPRVVALRASVADATIVTLSVNVGAVVGMKSPLRRGARQLHRDRRLLRRVRFEQRQAHP